MRAENVLRLVVAGIALFLMGTAGGEFAEFASGQMNQVIALAGGYR